MIGDIPSGRPGGRGFNSRRADQPDQALVELQLHCNPKNVSVAKHLGSLKR